MNDASNLDRSKRNWWNLPGRLYDWAGRVFLFMKDSLMSEAGRKAWAFFAMLGGCVIFTIMIFIGLYELRNHPGFVFWLAIAAHLQIFVIITAFSAFFVKRELEVGKDGAKLRDMNVNADEVTVTEKD